MKLVQWWLAVVLTLGTACRQSSTPETSSARSPALPQSASAAASASEQPFLSDDCPPLDASTDREISAQAAAVVPLKSGLTLSTTWHRATEGDDVECLTQIHDISGNAVAATANCSMSTGNQGGSRRTCRADMRAAHMYYTGAGDEPDVLRGTTMFSLSAAAFAELKSKGTTRHRFVSVSDGAIIGDIDGSLRKEGTATLPTIVNDRIVELPVVRATGTLRGSAMGKPVETPQLTIDGHTDSAGGAQANMELSRRRSEAVRAALIESYGVAASRLSARGYGATVPKDTNDTPDGRARNRRVELWRR